MIVPEWRSFRFFGGSFGGLAGLAIGVALAMVLARTLESMLYGVRTGDAVSLTIAALLLLFVTGVAAWLPALRATRIHAADVLRG